ncbi:hypothetical protein VTL71DRAFT_4630 [Oculimacula yallundae]|uniref:Uncharacterized protein n=1 Tax=Oculimacula yallundae TaxID=86028 RepID=A0ABR4C2H6_9HELO
MLPNVNSALMYLPIFAPGATPPCNLIFIAVLIWIIWKGILLCLATKQDLARRAQTEELIQHFALVWTRNLELRNEQRRLDMEVKQAMMFLPQETRKRLDEIMIARIGDVWLDVYKTL